MRWKIYNIPNSTFPYKILSLLWLIILSFSYIEKNNAQRNDRESPGISVARFALPTISPSTDIVNPTGTSVGEKIIELKKKAQNMEMGTSSSVRSTKNLYEKAIEEVNYYHHIVGEIEAKLQLATTPSNPKLVELRNRALHYLEKIGNTIDKMNSLAQEFSKHSHQVKALLSAADATFLLPGAVDQDHANLILLSSMLTNLEEIIIRIINIITANTFRQTEWLRVERIHFEKLAADIEKGRSSFSSIPKPLYPVPIDLPEITPLKLPQAKKKSCGENQDLNPDFSTPPLQPLQPVNERTAHTLKTNAAFSHEPAAALPSPQIPMTLEKKPLSLVTPHPKIHPLSDEGHSPGFSHPQTTSSGNFTSYSSVANGRFPLGLLEAHHEPRSQKWYLFSSAKRGLKTSSNIIEVVNIIAENQSSPRGEEVRNLLIEMGLKPEQVRLITVRAEDSLNVGQVYIFAR